MTSEKERVEVLAVGRDFGVVEGFFECWDPSTEGVR